MRRLRSQARIGTIAPDRYLALLCKSLPGEAIAYSDDEGRAEFGFGLCRMRASEHRLLLAIEADDEASLALVQKMIGEHLGRCMWRETPTINWIRHSR